MKYLIVCPERMINEELVWWKANYQGYTTNEKEAGRYTKEEVDKICNQPYVDDYGVLDLKSIHKRYKKISSEGKENNEN